MKTYVWQYWESDTPAPPYVRLCLETVARHLGGAEHVVLDEHSVEDRLPDLDPSWRRLAEAAHRADYVRSRLLERYGGIWLDADAVVLKDLSGLYTEDVSDADLLCWVNVQGLVAVNLLVAPPGSPVIADWVADQGRILEEASRSSGAIAVSWSALGSDSITPCARRGNTRYLAPARVAPISWRDAHVFTRPARLALERVLAPQPDLVMLYNKMLQPRLTSVSAAELLSGETLLAAILRIGLAESTAEEEVRRSRRLGARVRALLHRRA
jgi:hypothetical protein